MEINKLNIAKVVTGDGQNRIINKSCTVVKT